MNRLILLTVLASAACDRPATVPIVDHVCDYAVEAAKKYRAVFSPVLDTPVRYSRDIKVCESLGGAPDLKLLKVCASAMEHRAQAELPTTILMMQIALADSLLARYGAQVYPVHPGSCAAQVRKVWR